MKKITFCIPTKNNLQYLRGCLKSIEENSAQKHDVIIYVDGDSDGTVDWLISNNIRYIKNDTVLPKGIANGYNRCIEAAETEIVCMFHADMYMAKGFDINLLKHLKEGVVVSATRIEPPLHPMGLEKIVQNFGMYPEDFLESGFGEFVERQMVDDSDKTTKGIFAPWVVFKSDVMKIGMHDEFFHSYHEDSDIFNRMLLSGLEFIQSRDSFVYHFTCRGGKFADGVERETSDTLFHAMKTKAMSHYIRKWGSWIKNDEYQHPILIPKYDIGIVMEGGVALLRAVEPWCSSVYVKGIGASVITDYIQSEQPNTIFNLSERVLDYSKLKKHDIQIYIDNRFNQSDFSNLQILPQIIHSTDEVGEFELGNMKITITSKREIQNELI